MKHLQGIKLRTSKNSRNSRDSGCAQEIYNEIVNGFHRYVRCTARKDIIMDINGCMDVIMVQCDLGHA